MHIVRSAFSIFAAVVFTVLISVTLITSQQVQTKPNQESVKGLKVLDHEDLFKRYPTADFNEPLSPDLAKRAALKQRQARYSEKHFGTPDPKDEAIAYIPEPLFDFPGLPVNESDVIVIGQVASSMAHLSENKHSVFSEFEIRVDEVFKGDGLVTRSSMIIVERLGGFVKYPDGHKLLFFIPGLGMPEVGTRNVFFLKDHSPGFSVITGYELNPHGILALDQSAQFRQFHGQSEATFLSTLRAAIPKAQ